jgi:hypothetical protein
LSFDRMLSNKYRKLVYSQNNIQIIAKAAKQKGKVRRKTSVDGDGGGRDGEDGSGEDGSGDDEGAESGEDEEDGDARDSNV